jgi:hypothetical protein
VTPNPDGSVTIRGHGPWVLIDPFGTHIYNAGRRSSSGGSIPTCVVFPIDIVSRVGHSFDLCEALS